ncbi:MAG TPA: c-type cytochrome, partial [Isosphaeraceae bacterium]
ARPAFPRKLSETGLFASTRDLAPAAGVVPYAINAELWSDGARADRILAVPGTGKLAVDSGRLRFPDGSVLARTVSLELVEGDPRSRRRVETQILHREAGSWRPYSYQWDDAQADAALVGPAGANRSFTVRDPGEPGGTREHAYRFAARSECVLCHNPWVETNNVLYGRQSASPLATTVDQLDRGEQLRHLEALGLVDSIPTANDTRLADPRDPSAPLESRARAYLQTNCAHCHQIGAGGSANIVLGARTPLAKSHALDASPLQGTFGLKDARIIAPGEPERSVLYYRIAKLGAGRMPRVGSNRVDVLGTRLIADWIASIPRGSSDPVRGADEVAQVEHAASPAVRREAILRLIRTTGGTLALVRSIDASSISESVGHEAAALARALAAPEVVDLLERFLPESERSRRLGDAIDPAAILTRAGDARRGRELFRAGGAAACRSCHRADGDGVDIGPALDGVGSKYPRADLLAQILDPSRTIDPRYATMTIATRDGQVLSGIVVEDSPRALILRDAAGRTTRLAPADVEDRRREPKSLMPDGLLAGLTAAQAVDLLEYLAGLKSPEPPRGTGTASP